MGPNKRPKKPSFLIRRPTPTKWTTKLPMSISAKKRCNSPADRTPPSIPASAWAQPWSEYSSGRPVSVRPKKLRITKAWLIRSTRLNRLIANPPV